MRAFVTGGGRGIGAGMARGLGRGRGRAQPGAGGGRTASATAYLAGGDHMTYPPSEDAVFRCGETLANELAGGIPVFVFGPALVRSAMTEGSFPEDSP